MKHRFKSKVNLDWSIKSLVELIINLAKVAPAAMAVQFVGAIITSLTPLATTYFAGLTTTQLAAAYAGDATASNKAITYLIITLLLGVLLLIWNSIANYCLALGRLKITATLTDNLTQHYFQMNYAKYDDRKTIDTYDKASKFANQSSMILERLAAMLSSLLGTVAGIGSLFFVSWWIALLLLLSVLPVVFIQLQLTRSRKRFFDETIGDSRKLYYINRDLRDSRRTAEIRVFDLTQQFLQLRSQLRDTIDGGMVRQERRFIKYRLASYLLQAIIEAISLIYVLVKIVAHQLPIGQFIYVQQVISRTINSVAVLTFALSNFGESLTNLADYTNFLQLPTDRKYPLEISQMPDTISIRNVSFSYPNQPKHKVLHSINLDIKKGQRIALVGENGAGKTTLVKLILGLYRPNTGTIALNNLNLSKVKPSSWHRFISVMLQLNSPFSFANIRDNIRYGNIEQDTDDQTIYAALDKAEAKDFVNKKPSKLDSYTNVWVTGGRGANANVGIGLSGGQEQRLMLARSFYRNAPFVILDEPTSSIDALAESRIFDRIFKNKSKTILTVSHRLTTVKKADIIYVLENGRIVETGSHDDLIAKRGAYYRLFESQL
ncbi:MAG: ABC transporter ATP-binding protein [Candidatus Saccharibacteria bacterium]|nr:ABC transporter ATP-binding protein [Candidatus Saccharibacteria bacterium]